MQSQNRPNAPENETPGGENPEEQHETSGAQPNEDGQATDTSNQDDPGESGGIEAELADTKDRLLRALAESENVRRRASRDVENASKRAIAGFAREMVVVADNLNRALGAVDSEKLGDNDAVKSLLEGIEMTAREMQNAFSRNGIKKIDPLGERFDPQHHEAMFEFEDPSKPAGSVGQVLELGYTLHDQPLRPAKVGVTKGGPKQGAAPAPSEQTLNEAESEKSSSSGGTAYENQGKPSGSNLDEEL